MAKSMETRLVVRHFPDRVKPCLCIEQGNQAMILASFRNKECENLYREFLHGNCIQRDMRLLFEEKHTCSDCLLDGTDACSRGAGRAVDDRICEDFI